MRPRGPARRSNLPASPISRQSSGEAIAAASRKAVIQTFSRPVWNPSNAWSPRFSRLVSSQTYVNEYRLLRRPRLRPTLSCSMSPPTVRNAAVAFS
ncbi:hypothetical protein PPTG_23467 [Phytophthora nicotianae INRA-310]|uniref:Uncharacterized protein n=1 Tax=Phytophthora nicotianae (strain INRA-310) TaxID=761204 RepID=W2Q083_PHYN3|nr:hypothetical protein PPTG_23467 [Phytophthora nicotianae INRA-310]ETN05924.1 hypothetical protein PPTG_23467 [Phytophthora nicotianae INRA-310]